jgi:hypothetical protein
VDPYDLAARQHGAIARPQLEACGITAKRRRRWVAKGTLVELLPGVYRFGAAPVTWAQRARAATLWLPEALVSHRAAASIHGLRGFDRAPVEIVVDRWSRRSGHRSLIVHESKDLRGVDRAERLGIPVTTVVRTLIDLPAVVPPRRVGDALDGVLRSDPGILETIAARHAEVARRGRNGAAGMRALLRERGASPDLVDSGFERRMLELIADAGLPRPVTQHQVRGDHETCYLDIAWPDLLVGVECDSLAHHLNERAFRWERARRRLLTLQGWHILEFTYREVVDSPAVVAAEIGLALERARARAA